MLRLTIRIWLRLQFLLLVEDTGIAPVIGGDTTLDSASFVDSLSSSLPKTLGRFLSIPGKHFSLLLCCHSWYYNRRVFSISLFLNNTKLLTTTI